MPYQLNRVPFAAPDLLGAKTWPKNPSFAEDELKLVYEMKDEFLQARALGVFFAGFSITAMGTYFGLIVPNDEAWYIHRLSFESPTLAVGNTLGVSLAYTIRSATQGLLPIYSDPSRLGVAGERVIHGASIDKWINPGATAGIAVWNFAGAAIAGNCWAHITPVKL